MSNDQPKADYPKSLNSCAHAILKCAKYSSCAGVICDKSVNHRLHIEMEIRKHGSIFDKLYLFPFIDHDHQEKDYIVYCPKQQPDSSRDLKYLDARLGDSTFCPNQSFRTMTWPDLKKSDASDGSNDSK